MDDVAREARNLGLNWATSRVSAIEDGRFKATIDTLAVLAIAVGRATRGKPLGLAELLEPGRLIEISDSATMNTTDLLKWLEGKGSPQLLPGASVSYDDFHAAVHSQLDNMRGFTEAETRAAKDLGISPRQLIQVAHRLWGHGFIAERDSRAGDSPTPQKLGRISRVLKDEIRDEGTRGDD